jgi:hypothetical protein
MGKGEEGGECARKACAKGPAVGYNRSTRKWYCLDCSHLLNRENKADAIRLYGGVLVDIKVNPSRARKE